MADTGSGFRARAQLGAGLAVAMHLGTLTPFLFAALAPLLTREFDLSRTQLGLLITFSFMVGAVVSPAAGSLVDRLGGTRLLVTLFLSACAAFTVLAVADAYAWLVASAIIAGVPQALSNPVTNKLLVLYTMRGQQGILVGVKQSGVQLGSFVSGAVVAPLAAVMGWRPAVWLIVALGLLALALIRQNLSTLMPVVDDPTVAYPSGGVHAIAGGLAVYAFLMGAGIAGVNTYLPLFAYERLGLGVAVSGIVLSVAGITGMAGRIVWGRATDTVRSVAAPLVIVALLGAVATLLIASAAVLHPSIVWAGALVFGISAPAWSAIAMVGLLRLFASLRTGRASGFVLTGFFLGFACSPPFFGLFVDATGNYVAGWTGVALVFMVACAVSVWWHHRLNRLGVVA